MCYNYIVDNIFLHGMKMEIKRIVSFALIVTTGVFTCFVTTGCSSVNNSITIKKESRLKNLKQEPQNSRIVYLGGEYDYGAKVNFGPADVSFEMKGLR